MIDDVAAIREHLRALYGYDNGGDAPGWLSLFAAKGRGDQRATLCTAFAGDDLFGDLPDHIAARAVAGWDIYAGVCLQQDDPGLGRRGSADTALAMPSAFMDIDVAGPNHVQANLPAMTNEALDFVAALPLKPTLIVHSGGGLQAHWCFDMLEVIENDDDRELAKQLSREFQEFIIAKGRDMGWRLDATHDLARVLRIAGTLNWKSSPPTPVRILSLSDVRYAPADLRPMLRVKAAAQPNVMAAMIAPRSDGDVEARIRAYLEHKEVGPWAPGNRDNCAMKMAVFMRAQLGLSADETLAWLRALNAECAKPLPDAILQDKARRAGRAA
jgi:hypothetical protein